MKLLFLLFFLAGCTCFTVKTDKYEARYFALFNTKTFNHLTFDKLNEGDLSLELSKYESDPDEKAIKETGSSVGQVAGTAIRAAGGL